MKIIELLNKIANNEEVPKKIKVSCYEFKWREVGRYYANTTKGKFQSLVQDWLNNASKLNSEVEIIEDEEEIDIQSIDIQSIDIIRDYRTSEDDLYNDNFEDFRGTINELVQAVKQLDKNIKELR